MRVRALPTPGVSGDLLAAMIEEDLPAFLARTPSMEPPPPYSAEALKELFLKEYDLAAWHSRYGQHGAMPVRGNNSWCRDRYDQELARYGGPAGMPLSEWHFEQSSDVALHVLGAGITGRARRLGVAAQLVMTLCGTFIDDDRRIVDFLRGYRDFWHSRYAGSHLGPHRAHDAVYARLTGRLGHTVRDILRATRSADPGGVRSSWLDHCRVLHGGVEALVRSDQLGRPPELRDTYDGTAQARRLLFSYIHMTNNRLGITTLEEPYLAHLLMSAVADLID